MKNKDIQHIFLIGAKSLGAYGGYETFINKLTEYHQNIQKIKYHVACKASGDGSMNPYETVGTKFINENEFVYHNAHCFRIKTPHRMGSAQAILYDILALKECCRIIKAAKIKNPVVYVMACRIGPFMKHFYNEIHKLGGKIYVNPDGHEWMRSKWNKFVRKYWKISERIMVKYCDLVICDSITIEKYIHKCYDGHGISRRNPKTIFIAYGAEIAKSNISEDDPKLIEWYKENGIRPKNYYLVVGRFVPENSYETMIREFMKSHTDKDFVIITNENRKFYEKLEKELEFEKDKRVKFVGTVYDQELLKKIREDAYGYFHGHTVGGTNPSLIESLSSTSLNLLINVEFNREVAKDGALYWETADGELAKLIDRVDVMDVNEIEELRKQAKKRVDEEYTWQKIADKYERLWLKGSV